MTPVSVCIVSRGRPAALLRCLDGVEQLFYPNFELVVVADPAGCAALREAGWADRVKWAEYDVPNISAARNCAVGLAAGDLLAFIDDDAVPEPTWLDLLTAPFKDDTIVMSGGFVRGRNGISFQSRAAWVDASGTDTPISAGPDTLSLEGAPGRAPKVEGTNFAIRRETLLKEGGFDPAFRFYLDETDLAMRLAATRARVALVPGAEVHHGFLASAQRTASRVPRDLHEIGASKVVFLRKHGQATPEALDAFWHEQRARLMRHMVAGTAEPRDVGRVLATLEAGFRDGETRDFGAAPGLADEPPPFRRFAPRVRFEGSRVLSARRLSSGLWAKALGMVTQGQRVSLICLSPSSLYHRVRFESGIWVQTGGIFGRSTREQPMLQVHSFRARVDLETRRISAQRGLERERSK